MAGGKGTEKQTKRSINADFMNKFILLIFNFLSMIIFNKLLLLIKEK